VLSDDAGEYTVVASHSSGSVTSAVARLTVAEPERWQTAFYDDFADGDYDGWTVASPVHPDPVAPRVVDSPSDHAIAGAANTDPVFLFHPWP